MIPLIIWNFIWNWLSAQHKNVKNQIRVCQCNVQCTEICMKRSKNPDHDVVKLKLSKAKSAQKLFIKFIYQKILFGSSIPIELMHCNCNAHCNAMPFIICMDQWILLKEDQKNQEWKIVIKNMKVSTQPYRCECESDFQLISLEIYSSMNQTHWCQAQMKLKRIMSHLIAEIIIIIILNDIKANVKRIEFGILK